ncbi:uncharacterized protein si:ch211-214j8.12 [Antennarius striatus]|uniref:uncharacterized protein si:ch211-214j8.12 n=1 Tax=Antennarius striatus TaxID=241820 RepID=UPI0035AE6EC5
MPLFWGSGQRKTRKVKFKWSCRRSDEDGCVCSLRRLCLLNLADNMKETWVKDYSDNYLDRYFFRYIMGPFSLLPGELVEELTQLLATRKQLSRAALHLLLVPQLRGLSLEKCPCLVTPPLCHHIAARCQGLWSLDLSGAQQLSSKVLSETLRCLPDLRSLSVAGTPCDRVVIQTITQCCRFLRHLDISRCRFLSPAVLLLLGVRSSVSSTSCPSGSRGSFKSSSCSAAFSPPPLGSLLALDIGIGEQEEDPVMAAAFLLLSLPHLERVAMDGLGQACRLIRHEEFHQTDEFADREGVIRLGEVWQECIQRQKMDSLKEKGEGAAADEGIEDEDSKFWDEYCSDGEEDASREEGGSSSSQNQAEEQRRGRVLSGDGCLVLRLKNVKGLSCDSLDSLSCLCPDIHSLSINVDDDKDAQGRNQEFLLASGLQMWPGQLQSLSVNYSGPLVNLLPALEVAGSSLLSLTLEGVKTNPHTPILELIKTCRRLKDLHISAEPPSTPQGEEDEDDQQGDGDLPQLPNLSCLTLKFFYEHSQMKPVMSWMSLRKALRCLLIGSPLLEKISLVSLPCPVNSVLLDVLGAAGQIDFANSADCPPMPLGRVRHIELPRTDVKTLTVKSVMQRSKRIKYVDVSYCWQISMNQWLDCKTLSKVEVVWS